MSQTINEDKERNVDEESINYNQVQLDNVQKETTNEELIHSDGQLDINEKESFDYEINEDELMLSTIDNPYNPKTDYYMWKRWDKDNGYNTEEYIARLINMEEDFDVDDDFMLNVLTTKVINDILENDDLQLYRLV